MTTNELTNEIIEFIHQAGGFARRVNTSGIRGRRSRNKGAADIRILFKGVSIDVEVKSKDKLSTDQIIYKAEIESAGGKYWEVRTFEDFYNKFKNEL